MYIIKKIEYDSVKRCSARFSEITYISISINSRISTELDTGYTYNTAWAASELSQRDTDVPKHDDIADYYGPHVWCTLALYLVFDGALRIQKNCVHLPFKTRITKRGGSLCDLFPLFLLQQNKLWSCRGRRSSSWSGGTLVPRPGPSRSGLRQHGCWQRRWWRELWTHCSSLL